MKNILDKTLKNKYFYIYTIITIIFFGILVKPEYALDTFCILQHKKQAIVDSFSQGRFLKGIFYLFVLIPKGSFTIKYIATYALAIICLILSQLKLYSIIRKYISNNILSILISTLIVINPFVIELMLYYEKGIMILGILFSIYAAEFFLKNLTTKNKKHLFLAALLMLLADFSYQGISSIFIALCSVFICKYSKNIKDFIINNIKMVVAYIIPAIINVLIVRFVYVNGRVSGKIVLIDTIKSIYNKLPNMLTFYNILPLYELIIIISVIIFIIAIHVSSKQIKEKIMSYLLYLYVLVITVLSTIGPQLLQNTESIWLVPRATYGFGAIIGITLLYLFMNNKEAINKKKFVNIVLGFCFVILIAQYASFARIEIDHYILNYKDRYNSYEIGKMIQEYEKLNHKKIKYISYARDKDTIYTYQDIYISYDINFSGFGTEWSYLDMINHFNGKKLKNIEATKEEKNYCSKIDSSDITEENIKFTDNKIIVCVF